MKASCSAGPALRAAGFLWLSVTLLLLFGCGGGSLAAKNDLHATTDVQQRHPPASKEYIIGAGDILSINVWREPDLSERTITVRNDGRISVPLVGDVMAAGKSVGDLAAYLTKEYSKVVTAPAVSVILVENRSKLYYLVGQVQRPGEFHIDHPITVLQAIARGGGFLEWAKKDRIEIVRRGGGQEKRFTFNYDDFVNGDRPGQNILVSPGDTIIVP